MAWGLSLFINSQRCGSVYFSVSPMDEILWWGCGKRCFPVRGRSWFHWWRNWAVLLWGHGRRSSQVLPPRERPGIASVRCTYAYIWAGRSPSYARRLSLLRRVKRDSILPGTARSATGTRSFFDRYCRLLLRVSYVSVTSTWRSPKRNIRCGRRYFQSC